MKCYLIRIMEIVGTVEGSAAEVEDIAAVEEEIDVLESHHFDVHVAVIDEPRNYFPLFKIIGGNQ